MAERVTRSGRRVKSVVRYEPEEVNLVDDFSDGSFGDSEFEGTDDGISLGSHVENSASEDESYTETGTHAEDDDSSDSADTEASDEDSVITEHIPEEEIIEIPSSSEGEADTSDSDSTDDTDDGSDECSSDSDSSDASTSSDDEPPPPRHAWKKPRRDKPTKNVRRH